MVFAFYCDDLFDFVLLNCFTWVCFFYYFGWTYFIMLICMSACFFTSWLGVWTCVYVYVCFSVSGYVSIYTFFYLSFIWVCFCICFVPSFFLFNSWLSFLKVTNVNFPHRYSLQLLLLLLCGILFFKFPTLFFVVMLFSFELHKSFESVVLFLHFYVLKDDFWLLILSLIRGSYVYFFRLFYLLLSLCIFYCWLLI